VLYCEHTRYKNRDENAHLAAGIGLKNRLLHCCSPYPVGIWQNTRLSLAIFISHPVMPFQFSRYFNRAIWLKCHLYLALVFGLLFSLIGLTGSLSVYREEIDSLLNPDLVIEAPQDQPLSLDKIVAQVRKVHPNRHGAWTLEMPRSPDGAIIVWFENPKESVDSFYAPLMVAVNPYTGEVINSRFWGSTFTTWMLDCHTHLQLGADGRNIVAGLAVMLSLSVLCGLYLWWPGFSRFLQAFKVRQNQGLTRFLMDLHRLLGVLSAGFLLLLSFTGFHLAYPELLENLTASTGMGHGDTGPTISSTASPNDNPVNITQAVLVARGLFPSSEVRRVTTPAGELGTYKINLRQKHELNQHHPFTNVWVDRWSGQIRSVTNPIKFSSGQAFTTWQWPLHTGEALGGSTRLLWFFLGLTPLTLWLSGVANWLFRKGLLQDRPIDFKAYAQKRGRQLFKIATRIRKWAGQKLQPLIVLGIRKLAELIDRYKS
jgi:uncharacterized iron-regulated membrane protein